MIKIGENEIFQNLSFFMKSEDEADISIEPDGGNALNIKIIFESKCDAVRRVEGTLNKELNTNVDENKLYTRYIRIVGDGTQGVITFGNYDKIPVGQPASFEEPLVFATTHSSKSVSLFTCVTKLGHFYRVELQFHLSPLEVVNG